MSGRFQEPSSGINVFKNVQQYAVIPYSCQASQNADMELLVILVCIACEARLQRSILLNILAFYLFSQVYYLLVVILRREVSSGT
jgi:hypothetical protein